MINRVVLMGRIANALEIKQTQSGVAVLSFNLAVERSYSKKDEERQTDFISCVAWRQQAEFIGKYFSKGRMIAIEGSLRTRTYDDKNGTKHYITEVYVDGVSFTGEKAQDSSTASKKVSEPEPNAKDEDSIGVECLDDFEEILNDAGVPF